MRKTLIALAGASIMLSGCQTLGINRHINLCQTSMNLLQDAMAAELIAITTGKLVDEARTARALAQVSVQINCNTAPEPEPAPEPAPEPLPSI